MESEEITKLVDGIYKNILEKFDPGTRQMVHAGKAYLKALHGAASASRVYVDAVTKLARQAQQATWSGCSDIGSALMQLVEVCKETQAQQMNVLKAFYVDVLVPLETNLEKDTKVIQTEQKKFAQEHKQRMESYVKAENLVKKYRKKQNSKNGKSNSSAVDKELRGMQILEDERNKLDEFCEKSLKEAMTEERRRYGFVLERQCSLIRHMLTFHNNQQMLLEKFIHGWLEVAKGREEIPAAVENMFVAKMKQVNLYPEEDQPCSIDDDTMSMNSQLRKTKSADAAMTVENGRPNGDIKHQALTRTKSDFNVSSTLSLHRSENGSMGTLQRPMSLAYESEEEWIAENGGGSMLVKAAYSYLSNGEHQLSFLKGDLITIVGERSKGWQYGENMRTKCSGWFPSNYAEPLEADEGTLLHPSSRRRKESLSTKVGINGTYFDSGASSPEDGFSEKSKFGTNYKNSAASPPAVTKFGDSVSHRRLHQSPRIQENGFKSVPPPVIPAPVVPGAKKDKAKLANGGAVSLHSSNDSGFSNEPPPAPDVDYSDDETNRHTLLKKAYELRQAKLKSMSMQRKQESDGEHGGKQILKHQLSKVERRILPMRQSSSVGQLTILGRKEDAEENGGGEGKENYDRKIKRTKSLWKFRKSSEEVLEGMAMWKHRSLVDLNAGAEERGDSNTNLPREPISPLSSKNGTRHDKLGNGKVLARQNAKFRHKSSTDLESEDTSDGESCIVINDHGRADSSILPRTHLSKSNSLSSAKFGGNSYQDTESEMVFESTKLQTFKHNKMADSSWYDSWGERRKN